ncbi:MAG: hypothetical protein NTW16_01325 [Bacteroidetes bacterium]|nr:hypothetical protein [Bacteroidota bacterium]
MKSIKFTDLELESMIDMYTAEMEEAQMYIKHIQELLKKLGAKPAKAEPVEKEKAQGKKRGRKPAVKEAKAPVEPKIKAVAKVKAEKKPVVKPAPKKKPEAKVAAKVESVVTSLLTAPKKEVKKVVKNKPTGKKRKDTVATSAKLAKPLGKKAPKVNVVPGKPQTEPTVAPTEQS